MFSLKVLKLFRKMMLSRATTPPRSKQRPTFKPHLEVLEERVLLNNDLLIWNPSQGDGTLLASHAANWWDDTQHAQGVEAAGIGNGEGCQVWLSSAKSNSDITWDESVVVNNILLTGGGGAGGGSGYNAQQTVNAGVTITATDGIGMSGASSSLNVRLTDAQSGIDITGGIDLWTNFVISGAGNIQFLGEQLTIGSNSNYTQCLESSLSIGNGGTVIDQGQCTFNFGDASRNLSITINSQSNFLLYGGNNTNTLINCGSGCYFDVNGGTFAYTNEGATADIIDAGIYVHNSGALTVGSNGLGDGGLEVYGIYTDSNNVTASVYMRGGTVQLSGGAGLNCIDGYYQSGGTLETTDTTRPWLQVGAIGNLGLMTIAGGSLALAQTPGNNQYGSLTIVCGQLDFSGTYDAKINAGKNGECDSLIVSGVLNINNGSSLEVFVVGTLDPAKKGTEDWMIIQGARNNLNAFATNNDQMTGLTDTPDLPKKGSYQVSW